MAPWAEGLGFELQIGPDHGHTIIRIIRSPHSCLGTIVDVRSTRVGHLKKDDHALEFAFRFIRFTDEVGFVVAARPDIHVVGEGVRFPIVGPVAIYDHGGHAIRIVRIEKILQQRNFLLGELFAPLFDEADKIADGKSAIDQPTFDGHGKSVVVHHPVKLPLPHKVRGFDPDFRSGVGLGLDRVDQIVPLGPETGTDFVRNVETPTIHSVRGISVPIGIHPAAGDGEEVSFDLWM